MTMPMPDTGEQFRMTRLQVFNWGTFSGLHDIPVSKSPFDQTFLLRRQIHDRSQPAE